MIDYSLIAKSIDFYESFGFKRIETPWTVTEAVCNITKPPEAKAFKLTEKNKVLVGSAEQGFLYLYLKGFLPKGQFQSCGPCFRDESFDNWHTKYFIKNELIKTDDTSKSSLDIVIDNALDFFESVIREKCQVIKTFDNYFFCESYDITYNGIELGSYGIRKCDYLKWIYGTALAEPRTSMLLNKFKNEN